MYEMKENYYIGIESIDKEHEKLFAIAESAYQLLQNEFIVDKFDGIHTIFEELKEYAKKHFTDEEEYMESINYKRLFMQKVQHQEFINKLEEIDINEMDENPENTIRDFLTFLTDWLINHILNVDMLIGK